MRFLKPVNVLAAANMLCFAYLITGVLTFVGYLFKGGPASVALPFGLVLPEARLTLNVHVFRSSNIAYTTETLVLCITGWLVTGWLTGGTCALVYNLVARFFGVEDSKQSLPLSTAPPTV